MEKQKKQIGIEIYHNLTQTINKMDDKDIIRSEKSIFHAPRAKKSSLISKREEVINKCGLTKKDLK